MVGCALNGVVLHLSEWQARKHYLPQPSSCPAAWSMNNWAYPAYSRQARIKFPLCRQGCQYPVQAVRALLHGVPLLFFYHILFRNAKTWFILCDTVGSTIRKANQFTWFTLLHVTMQTDTFDFFSFVVVNQIWFTFSVLPHQSESKLIHYQVPPRRAPCGADSTHRTQGREGSHKTTIWRVCGAVWRCEPYNLTPENKTYYTQNDDSMR